MLKKIIALLTVCAAAISCTACMKKTVETMQETEIPPKLVFLGDSIPAGFGLEGYTDDDNYHCRSYSVILRDKYEEELKNSCGHEMVNAAVTGDTSTQLLEHLKAGEFDEYLSGSDAVVISIGGNDILEIFLNFLSENLGLSEKGKDDWKNGDVNFFTALDSLGDLEEKLNTALDKYEITFAEIISQVQKKTSGEIFVQTLYNPFEYYDKIDFLVKFADEKIGRINSTVWDNAATGDKENYTVIDVASDFKGKCGDLTTIKSFDIHPNAEGHEEIARLADEVLKTKSYRYPSTKEVTDVKAIVILTASVVIVITVSAAAAVKIKKRTHK